MRAELPVFSFLSLFGLILILPGQVKSPTIPAVSVIFWLFVSNLIHGVNSIVWAGNTAIHSPAWCDIATKLLLGAMVAVPGAFLCICRHLEFATSRREVAEKANRLRQSIFEVSLCIVSPIVYMALRKSGRFVSHTTAAHWHFADTIVQDHRFSIVQDLGCQAAVYNYLPALILVWLPPLLLSLISLLYCGKRVRSFFVESKLTHSQHLH
ncbi:STE3-domain-containing protein [Dentipellis sp. KUC8613]|nr:STE3-domain-containing protein [Dentipellis sp. KUC8613]